MHVFKPRSRTPATRPEPAPESGPSLRRLAHEINSLLDGSMRSVRLAERALHDAAEADVEEARGRLRVAREAMGDMAQVLRRAMGGETADQRLLRSPRRLGEEAELARERVLPLAERAGVTLALQVDPEVRALPAGPLGAVLVNGLRNAIEACSGLEGRRRSVEAWIGVEEAGGDLVIRITDTGPGLPGGAAGTDRHGRPGGHGLGLLVCRDVVAALGGGLTLANAEAGRGAVLRILVPRASLPGP